MRNFYVYQAVLLANLSFLLSGTSLTWSSPMLSKLHGDDDNPIGRHITASEDSWLASISTLSAGISCVTYGILTSNFGRKTLLLTVTVPFLTSFLIMAWASNILMLFIGRFLAGAGLGGVFTIAPMYCGELADVENRGILGTSTTVFINVGMLIPYCLGPYIPFFWFHMAMASLSVIYVVAFYLGSPESPHYLIKKDEKKAIFVLEKLRGPQAAARELEDIRIGMEKEAHGSFINILQNKGFRRAFIIGVVGFLFMTLTGTVIIVAYCEEIFEGVGGIIPPEISPIIIAVAQLITTIIVSSIADRFPRKLLLTISHLGVSLVLIPFGLYFFLKERGDDVSNISWLPLTCLVLYVIIYNIGIGPILMAFLGELFPSNVKGIALSFIVIFNFSAIFALMFSYNSLTAVFGTSNVFWMFSASGFMAIIFIKFYMIETKGKTLQEIQDELNS